jgi:hypothetical protein
MLGLALGTMVLAVTTACDTGASPTPTTTATSGLLEKLSLMPATFKEKSICYGDLGRVLEMAGIPQLGSLDELLAQSDEERDAYRDASKSVVLDPGFVNRLNGEPEWEQVFGFDFFGISLALMMGEVSTGMSPRIVAYL